MDLQTQNKKKNEQLAGNDGLTDAVTIYHHMHSDAGEIEKEQTKKKKEKHSQVINHSV